LFFMAGYVHSASVCVSCYCMAAVSIARPHPFTGDDADNGSYFGF